MLITKTNDTITTDGFNADWLQKGLQHIPADCQLVGEVENGKIMLSDILTYGENLATIPGFLRKMVLKEVYGYYIMGDSHFGLDVSKQFRVYLKPGQKVPKGAVVLPGAKLGSNYYISKPERHRSGEGSQQNPMMVVLDTEGRHEQELETKKNAPWHIRMGVMISQPREDVTEYVRGKDRYVVQDTAAGFKIFYRDQLLGTAARERDAHNFVQAKFQISRARRGNVQVSKKRQEAAIS